MTTLNPDFAQEFIRLLRDENEVLRAKIQEFEQRANNIKPPSYDDIQELETLRNQRQELLDERNSLRTQVAALRNTPCTNATHLQASARLDVVNKQLADIAIQKSEQEQLHKIRILELEEDCRMLKEEITNTQQAAYVTQHLSTSSSFDVDAFCRELKESDTPKPKLYRGPFFYASSLRLPEGAAELMPFGAMRFSQAEVIWKSPGAPLFLAFCPMHVFNHNASKGEGRWERGTNRRELVQQVEQKRDILFLHDHMWHYYGTYKCVGSVPLSAREAENIGSTQMVAYAEKRTHLDSEHAPPYMGKVIHDLYAQGILQIECFGFRRVGFNEALNALLIEQKAGHGDNAKSRKVKTSLNTSPSKPRNRQGETKQSQTDSRRNQSHGRKLGLSEGMSKKEK
ncbi:hypothetical protein BC835DRAFT_1410248 [Cytidiella melzeri]|nr:hypothetical protein BC835DRAFT_1410248 [Cytidiella melzeri]